MKKNTKTKSNRGLVNRTAISNAVDNNIYNAFNELSKKTNIAKSKLLDEALNDIVKKYKKRFPNLYND